MAVNTDERFAQNLRRFRERAGLRQAELVDKLRAAGLKDWHPTTLSRTETGERPVRLSEAAIIAEVLGFDLAEMMRGASVVDRAADELNSLIDRVKIQQNSFRNTRIAYIRDWNEAWRAWQELDSFELDDTEQKRVDALGALLRSMEPSESDVRESKGLLDEQRTQFTEAAIAARGKAALDRPFNFMSKAERDALLSNGTVRGSDESEA